MRKILLAAALAAGSAFAQDSPFLKDEALQAEIARSCASGCVVLSPGEAAALTEAINMLVQQREQAAFEAGFAKGSKSCRNAT